MVKIVGRFVFYCISLRLFWLFGEICNFKYFFNISILLEINEFYFLYCIYFYL